MRGWQWWPFVLLLVVGASRWLLVSARPETEPTLPSLTVGCLWAALVCAAFARRSVPARDSARYLGRGLIAGALLLGGPMLAMVLGVTGVESSALVMALALTPVAVGVAASALGNESTESLSGRIWPGIAAVTGLLLVLVEPSFSDLRADAVLALVPVVTGLGAAMFAAAQRRGVERESLAPSLTQWLPLSALLGGTAVFAVGWAGSHLHGTPAVRLSLTAVAADGVFALLNVLALARLGAVRWSAQFTLLPLLILLEGIVMVRPVFTTRWVVGLVLVAAASVYLLLPQDDDEPEPAD
jgi:drug/metabolite transporter (DMT)-like permease